MQYHVLMVLCLIATFGPVLAHFQLNSPPAIGFDDDLEGESPCGGFEVDFASDTVTDFHIGGDSLAMQSTHPQSNWLFRATLDRKASGNWTNLLPVVSQSGLGNYCAKGLTLPSSWAGSSGVVQVVQHGPDSTLYQCAAVDFVDSPSPGTSACQNSSGVTATYTIDSALSNLPAAASATTLPSTTTITALPSTATTSKPSTAASVGLGGAVKSLMWWALVWAATAASAGVLCV